MRICFLILACVVGVVACAPKEPSLMHAAGQSRSEGPDEFAISTNLPLVDPENYATLPTPNPGGSNRADLNAQTLAAQALGGTGANRGGQAPSSALLAHASRFGYSPNIRNQLAAEDLEFRKKNQGKLMERWFGVNVYFDSYRAMSLDQYAELARLRALGIPAPAAPPDPAL